MEKQGLKSGAELSAKQQDDEYPTAKVSSMKSSNADGSVQSSVESTDKELGQDASEMKTKGSHEGLSVVTAIFFVVGDVVGAGIVALPYAMKLVGYLGVPMFMFCSSLMCYCGVLLAQACSIIMKNIDRSTLRDPYARLASEATGRTGKYVVTISLTVNQILTCIVFILLAGETLLELIPYSPWDHMSYRVQLRIWFLLCGLLLLPFTFLGTPKDFSGIGFLAMATSGLAVVLIVFMLGYISQYPVDNEKSLKLKTDNVLHAFGTVLFGFGGVSIFPTIQNDMKTPEKFKISVTAGYFIVSVVYILLPLGSYIALGDLIREDLLTTFSYLELYYTNHLFRTFCMTAQAAICAHVLCAFVLNINPVYQQLEGIMGIPTKFCWQRVANRTMMMVFILVFAVIIPNFGPVLSFVGGSFAALLGIIFPVVFYAKLTSRLPLWKEVLFFFIIVVALFGSVGNGYVEIKNIINVVFDRYHHT